MDSDYSNCRLSPSSSVLVALSTLTPPSPVLTPSLLSTSITSGDIPILLDGLDFSVNHRLSTSSLNYRRISARSTFYSCRLSQSNSSASINTFGPVSKHPKPECIVPGENNNLLAAMGTVPTSLYSTPALPSENHLVFFKSHGIRLQEQLGNLLSLGSEVYAHIDEEKVRNETTSENGQTAAILCSSNVIAKDSSQSSPSGSGIRDTQDLSKQVDDTCASHTAKGKSVAMTVSVSGCHTERGLLNQSLDKAKNKHWLESVEVILSIDQEGFRSVNPSFRFVGCFPQALDGEYNPIESMARFIPINRENFHFHYAPFDGLPCLRRVSLNGNETRDYISRQANLGIKSNGIYTVHGTELATSAISDDHQQHQTPVALYWQFAYRVDDRRVETSRKIMDGEKNLTPLSFSCSPGLLHPSQGKRVKLMHIVKKSVATKLTAEKLVNSRFDLEAEDCLTRRAVAARSILRDVTNTAATTWHRRALSSGLQSESAARGKRSVRNTALQENQMHPGNRGSVGDGKRRRASSAGELKGRDSQTRTKTETDALKMKPSVQRHIVNPTRLARMLEVHEHNRNINRVVQTEFCPLTPDPHHYRMRVQRNVALKAQF
ncbi:hypothetical protein AX17_000332 [Amanita inopinata Kibby_2008]|nr:hypothetical protein AX17_000332 [Amanita inopinata Kibby_2008]